MRERYLGLLAALLLPLLSACSSPTSAPAEQTGTLKGRITRVLDQNFEYPADMSGVTVSFDGAGLSTTTDSTGRWTMNNLPTRTYDITYSKPGYGSIHQYGYQFVGGGTVFMQSFDITMEPVTQVLITSLQARLVDTAQFDYQYLELNVTPTVTATQQKTATLFFTISKSASTSIDNRAGAWILGGPTPVNRSSKLNIALDELRNRTGLQSGDTAYITAYAVSGAYTLPETGQVVYASHSAAATTSIVIP